VAGPCIGIRPPLHVDDAWCFWGMGGMMENGKPQEGKRVSHSYLLLSKSIVSSLYYYGRIVKRSGTHRMQREPLRNVATFFVGFELTNIPSGLTSFASWENILACWYDSGLVSFFDLGRCSSRANETKILERFSKLQLLW
jgi:hypothetical protein